MGISAASSDITRLLNFQGGKSLPAILQTEAAECGLACLAMIASYHGFETDLASMRRRFAISTRGVTLKSLIELAGQINLQSRALRCEISDLPKLQLPCILHWDMNHFVVLRQVTGKKVIIHDPAIGKREIALSELGKHFTGIALELTPTADFVQGEEKQRVRLKQLWSRATGLKRALLLVLALSFLLQLFALAVPLYMQTVVDDVILSGDYDLLLALALGFGLLLITQVATEMVRQYSILGLSSRLNLQLAANVFRHLIRLPTDFFGKRHMGDVVSRFGSLQSIQQLISTGLVTAVVDGVMSLVMLVAMFMYSGTLTIVVLVVVALYTAIRAAHFFPLKVMTEESLVAKAKHDTHFMESVKSIQTLKIFQKENDRQAQWQNKMVDYLNRDIRIAGWNINYQVANQILFGVENIVVIYLAARMVVANDMTIGMLYAFISYKGRFISSIESLVAHGIELKMVGLHLERLSDIILTPGEKLHDENHLPGTYQTGSDPRDPKPRGGIEVRSLGFRYGKEDEPVFQNISFKVEPGETVAIVGPSGCGKTTLVKCLMGLLEPTEGEILVDGTPIQKLPGYRGSIAAVMQDDTLLSGSVLDNIACFDAQVDVNAVVFSAQLACIHEEIMKMPMQYNTLVGDMGSNLSGGQRQRVILARAFYRRPQILYLDEATSNLDTDSERAINMNIKQLNITRVMIAHRPETIASAGRVIEVGRKELTE